MPLTGFLIGFFSEGGDLFKLMSDLMSMIFDYVIQKIKDLFNSLFTAIKDAFIGFVINPIISVLNKIPGVDIEPLMTTEEQARAAGQNTTGTEQIGSTFTERITAKGLIKGASVLGSGTALGMEAYDRLKKNVGKEAAETVGEQAAKTAAKKAAGKTILKTALKKIPLLGLGFGAAFAAQRALEGDYAGAGAELLSGALGATGVGAPAGLVVDAGLFASDMAGITGPAMVQNRNNFGATPSAAQLKNNLDMARQSAEEVRSRPQQQMGGDINNVVVGGATVQPTRVEVIQPPPEAGTDMGVWRTIK